MKMVRVNNRDVFRFVSLTVKANMYVMIEGNEALIVDPHNTDEIFSLLNRIENIQVTILLTHEHPDHTCGVQQLMETYGATLICQRACAVAIADKRNNRPLLMTLLLATQDKANGTDNARKFRDAFPVYECTADITFEREFSYRWCSEVFEFTATPGHSPGSCCILWNRKAIFTGDSLILDTPVITRFPGGNVHEYNRITKPYLHSLSEDTVVLPGHGEMFTIRDKWKMGKTYE